MCGSFVESLAALWRDDPVETVVLTVVPVLLAGSQLAIGVLTDTPLAITLAFAGALLGFAVIATGHSAAWWQRRRLDRLAFDRTE